MDNSLLAYGIMAVDPDEFVNESVFHVLHLVGYENPPDVMAYQELYQELRGEILKDKPFILVPALEQVMEDARNAEDDEYEFEVHEGGHDAEDS